MSRIGSPILHTLQGALRHFESFYRPSTWQKVMSVMPSLCPVKVVCQLCKRAPKQCLHS